MTTTILQGHVLDVLAGMKAKSVHTVVTSPPYWNLRAYGTPPQVWANPDGTPLCDGEHDLTWDGRMVKDHGAPDVVGRATTLGIAADGSGKRVRPDNQAFRSAPSAALHEWGDPITDKKRGQAAGDTAKVGNTKARVCPPETQQGSFCRRCGAWRGELGSEPTIDLFVAHLVEVFEAVKRVLRDDGTLWVNLGDSYAGSWGNQGRKAERGEQRPISGGMLTPVLDGRYPAKASGTGTIRDEGLKPGDLCMVPARFALAMQQRGWTLRSEITLCLSGGTRVYARTAKGDMPVMLKDLVRLDPLTVKLWNGTKWTQVLAWTRHVPTVTWDARHAASQRRRNARLNGKTVEPSDYLELEFRSGERVGCTPEHLWPTSRGVLPASELRVGDVVPTTRLPEPEDAKRPRALDDEAVGWFVGFYLAEGSKDAKTIRFAVHANETAEFDRIKRIAEDFHGSANWRLGHGNGASISCYGRLLHAILDTYIAGHGAEGKRLSNACWQRSDAFLRAVLQGYLDGDGHWRAAERVWTLGFTRNDDLAADLRTLAARLGAVLRLKTGMAKMGDREFPAYRGYLRITPSTHHAVKENGEIIGIHASRARTFWDVTVEDEPHLFSLASGLLTHNCKTAPMPESVQGARWERCRVKTAKGAITKRGWDLSTSYAVPVSAQQQAEWADCPGCPKCAATEGYVQRWGSGRPTQATEKLFLFSKAGARYFYDLEATRLPLSQATVEDGRMERGQRGTKGEYGTVDGNAGFNPAGRNAWSWMFWKPEPLQAAHYAAYPRWLPRLAIQAGTSERGCCPGCGAPWLRVVQAGYETKSHGVEPQKYAGGRDERGGSWTAMMPMQGSRANTTLGWRQSCSCPPHQPTPCTALDPFSGSGTTVIEANALGRHGIGVELQERYVAISHKRLSSQPVSLFAYQEPEAAG